MPDFTFQEVHETPHFFADLVDSETGYFTVPERVVIIKGLVANEANEKYVLTEVSPPLGYLVTIQPIEFTIDVTGTVTNKDHTLNAGKVSFFEQ